jgi:hypothetical protein
LHFRAGQSQLASRKILFYFKLDFRAGQANLQGRGREIYYLNKLYFRAGQANLQGEAGRFDLILNCTLGQAIVLYFILFKKVAFYFRAGHCI